ncbi:MAG: Glu/Leu/Phe/Val dehydrogenase, partial [Actinobacteria bacterium]|nr:Glu/Leu/Phe/Val dehydrogenase [Actinomycetota bacterium]
GRESATGRGVVEAAALMLAKQGTTLQGKRVADCGVGEVVARGEKGSAAVFGLPCDIVMPCALGDAVGEAEAQTITAKLVVEGANGPLTPGADHVLADRGVVVIPDVYANAGGVTCSYLEQCQNFAHLTWDEDEVNARVIDLMRAAFEKFYAFAQESGLPYRLAASVLGVKTIADAHRMRGLHP